MNIGQIKVLAWLAAALLTLGLAFYVYRFLGRLSNMPAPSPAFVKQTLEDVEPVKNKTEDLVAYDDVVRLLLPGCEACKRNDPNHRHLNWTGKEKPPPVDDVVEPVDVAPVVVPVKELVAIAMIKVDLAEAANSSVFLRYKPKAAIADQQRYANGHLLKLGQKLAAPHDKIVVEEIRPDGVVFAFEGSEREKETLGPQEFDARAQIVQVGPDGVVMPSLTNGVIPKGSAPPFRPGRTTAIGENKFMLGLEDLREIEQRYPEILASEVRTDRHRDPKTGRFDGIEIKSLAANSIAASHGAQEGDIVKSINGHPVTGLQDAITYVKNNSGQYTTWEVVVESKGKLKTLIYHSPSE